METLYMGLHAEPRSHDTGSKQSMGLLIGVKADAWFAGADSEHRLTLERCRNEATNESPLVLWIGMNPSSATALADDLTVRKEQIWTFGDPCRQIAGMGVDRYVKMNLGTYRATQPSELSRPGVMVNYPTNGKVMQILARRATRVILACGKPPLPLMPVARAHLSMLFEAGIALECLGVTKEGWPLHSSRLGYVAPPGRADRFMPFTEIPAEALPSRRRP